MTSTFPPALPPASFLCSPLQPRSWSGDPLPPFVQVLPGFKTGSITCQETPQSQASRDCGSPCSWTGSLYSIPRCPTQTLHETALVDINSDFPVARSSGLLSGPIFSVLPAPLTGSRPLLPQTFHHWLPGLLSWLSSHLSGCSFSLSWWSLHLLH